MTWIIENILTLITFIPLFGAIVILLIPKGKDNVVKWVALLFTVPQLSLAWWLYHLFDRTAVGFQFTQQMDWIAGFNIQYFVGIDGLSIPMVLLTALLCPICVVASWNINKAVKAYFALFLLLDVGMMGVFVALDFFLFYVFWEVMLLPMYFLIGIWGGPRREYAAIKFFLYTLLGSVLMLLAILWLYFVNEPHTFNMIEIMQNSQMYRFNAQLWVWMALFIGFAIKVPIFPFHTWLPDAHVEAPTAVSVILAGVLLKMGAYGILRINFPMLPEATVYFNAPEFFNGVTPGYPLLALLGVINIIYGAFCAMAQKDLKRLVAYSSISHMGFVLLGIASFTPEGMNGAVLQMFNHGIVSAMLFLLVGVIYDRAHHRDINGFGGLAVKVPIYTVVSGVAFFAALGLPGLNSFISEALVFLGSFQKYPFPTMIAATGIIITAAYCLWTVQRIFLGPLNEKYKDLSDMTARELITLLPLLFLVILLGIYPMPILDLMKTSLGHLLGML